jgi:hypothetical protein
VAAKNGVATFSDLKINKPYTYKLDATSGALTATSDYFVVAAPDQTTSLTMSLNEGLNLISLPLIPEANDEDSNIETVLESIIDQVDIVWSYNAGTGKWTSYAPGAETGNDLTTMEDGKGYWVNMKAATQITFTGTPIPAGGAVLPPAYDVYTGWNLVGFKSVGANSIETYLTGTDYRLPIYGYALAYEALNSKTSEFQPGFGYWVYFNANGVITPSDATSSK